MLVRREPYPDKGVYFRSVFCGVVGVFLTCVIKYISICKDQ